MAKIHLNTTTTLFKGMKGPMTNTQAGLFWVTKSIRTANLYAKTRGGITRAYKPTRRLKLLKLSRESLRRLLMTNIFSPNLKQKLILLFGIGISYGNQYKGLVKLNKRYWTEHFRQKAATMVPNWSYKGGRISVTNTNYKLFANIRHAIRDKYDGIYVPEMRTPHYPTLSFPAEYILFNPRQDLVNVTTEYNMNKARANLNTILGAMNTKRQARLTSRSSLSL